MIQQIPKVLLISMPWTSLTEPSLGLSILKSKLNSAGPKILNFLYKEYPLKDQIRIIHYKHTSPIKQVDACRLLKGSDSPVLHRKLKDAFVIHYFSGTWVSDELSIDCRS